MGLRDMDHRDEGRRHLRGLLLAAADSQLSEPVDSEYFRSLRGKVHQWQEENRKSTDAYNEYVEENGVFGDHLRCF